MFGQDRDQIRRFFIQCWNKQQRGEALQGLELLIAQVVERHPEYHELLIDEKLALDIGNDPHGQSNPFLHLGMHITLAEQLASDRPAGVRALQHRITLQTGDAHQAEHRMMECLGSVLWEAQQQSRMPDEQAYLECLRKLL